MKTAITAALWIVRVTGMVQVVLGLLFWSNHAFALVPVHMAIGLAFVLGVWTLAGLGARARVGTVLVSLTALWGIVVLALGMTQGSLLPGPAHWVVKALHLAVGIVAMVLANLLAARTRKRRSIPASSRPHPSTTERSLTAS